MCSLYDTEVTLLRHPLQQDSAGHQLAVVLLWLEEVEPSWLVGRRFLAVLDVSAVVAAVGVYQVYLARVCPVVAHLLDSDTQRDQIR